MKKSKALQIAIVILSVTISAILFTSCQNEPTPVESNQTSLPKFTLPAGATFESATFNVKIVVATNQDINVHRITAPWEEGDCVTGVTWNNFNGSYSPTIEETFNASATGWTSVDVTDLVGNWLNGTYPNYGLLLDQVNQTWPRTEYDTREWDASINASYLEICYTLNGSTICDTTRNVGDTYIYQLNPDENNGCKGEMYTGWGYYNDLEKQVLINFDIEQTPGGNGCTLTPGYWKTHSAYGPAPYDATWALIGEDTPFFLSGKTYYQVLWIPPAGNAYYNLSFHYIAAGLNFLNGADPSAAQAAFDAATLLFNTYTPEQIKPLKGNNPVRKQFIELAGILGDYNEGDIGPGHCDD